MTSLITLGSGQPTSVAPPEDVAPKLIPVAETPVVVPAPQAADQLIVPAAGPAGRDGTDGVNGDWSNEVLHRFDLVFYGALIG